MPRWRTSRASCSTRWCFPTAPRPSRRWRRTATPLEFIKDQFRHCKTILALGASRNLLVKAGLPVSMDKSLAQGGTGLIIAEAGRGGRGHRGVHECLAKHRHFGREMDPPLV